MQNPDDDRIDARDRHRRVISLSIRLDDILRRQIRHEDCFLSDHDFIEAVIKRYRASREDYLIDPNE